MKKAVNLRLEENVIITLNQLLEFAGKLKSHDADNVLQSIVNDKNAKEFELDL